MEKLSSYEVNNVEDDSTVWSSLNKLDNKINLLRDPVLEKTSCVQVCQKLWWKIEKVDYNDEKNKDRFLFWVNYDIFDKNGVLISTISYEWTHETTDFQMASVLEEQLTSFIMNKYNITWENTTEKDIVWATEMTYYQGGKELWKIHTWTYRWSSIEKSFLQAIVDWKINLWVDVKNQEQFRLGMMNKFQNICSTLIRDQKLGKEVNLNGLTVELNKGEWSMLLLTIRDEKKKPVEVYTIKHAMPNYEMDGAWIEHLLQFSIGRGRINSVEIKSNPQKDTEIISNFAKKDLDTFQNLVNKLYSMIVDIPLK